MSQQDYEIFQQLELTKVYADREGLPIEEAAHILQDIGKDYDDPLEFLEDIGLEEDYIFDATQFVG